MSLVEAVRRAGIIGCGGAGFPTHVKIDSKVDLVVVNGAECEPLLNSDQRVMEKFADEMLQGLRLVMQQTGAKEGCVAIKAGYDHAIEAVAERIEGDEDIELNLLGNFYPAGDEQILLTEINGKIVPEGGIPLQVGAVVSNVLTFVQIARANAGQVVTDRQVTLTGEVKRPQVVTAPIGTSVRDLLAVAEPAIPAEDMVVIDGGPMMGKIVPLDAPINKTTSGLIFLAKDHPLITWWTIPMDTMVRRSIAACCQCRECTEVCSRYMQGHDIEPHAMMRSLAYKTDEPTNSMTSAFLCSQCGLCEYACPMYLSPRRAYMEILASFRASGFKNPHTNAPETAHEFRRFRKIGKDRLIRRYMLTDYDRHDLMLMDLPAVPSRVTLSLTQAIGAPSEPVVEVGQPVAVGDLVAKIPEGKLSSNLHASLAGRVAAVDEQAIVIEGTK